MTKVFLARFAIRVLLSCDFALFTAQRNGSPAADWNKTRLRKITFSANWPPHTRAEGGQVEPVLGSLCCSLH
jgi:hypothetical protein